MNQREEHKPASYMMKEEKFKSIIESREGKKNDPRKITTWEKRAKLNEIIDRRKPEEPKKTLSNITKEQKLNEIINKKEAEEPKKTFSNITKEQKLNEIINKKETEENANK